MVAVVQVVLYGGVMQCRVVSPLLQWLVLRRKPRTFLAVQMGSFANFSPLPYLSSFFSSTSLTPPPLPYAQLSPPPVIGPVSPVVEGAQKVCI